MAKVSSMAIPSRLGRRPSGQRSPIQLRTHRAQTVVRIRLLPAEPGTAGRIGAGLRLHPCWGGVHAFCAPARRRQDPGGPGGGVSCSSDAISRRVDQEGYPYLSGSWKQGDRIDTDSDMPVRAVAANPPVVQDAGKVAMTKESIVYCAEEMDNRANLHLLYLNGSALLDDANRVRVEPFTFQTGAVPDDPRA